MYGPGWEWMFNSLLDPADTTFSKSGAWLALPLSRWMGCKISALLGPTVTWGWGQRRWPPFASLMLDRGGGSAPHWASET